MATWQADFHVLLPPSGLPSDYRTALDGVLPRGASWTTDLEVWGVDDSDRIDVWNAGEPEMFARFDLRKWDMDLYERFLVFVRAANGRLRTADNGNDVELTSGGFIHALRSSPAAQFVENPEAYLRSLDEHRDTP